MITYYLLKLNFYNTKLSKCWPFNEIASPFGLRISITFQSGNAASILGTRIFIFIFYKCNIFVPTEKKFMLSPQCSQNLSSFDFNIFTQKKCCWAACLKEKASGILSSRLISSKEIKCFINRTNNKKVTNLRETRQSFYFLFYYKIWKIWKDFK